MERIFNVNSFLKNIPRWIVSLISMQISFLLLAIFYVIYAGALDLIGYILGFVLVLSIFVWPIIWIFKIIRHLFRIFNH